VSAVTQLFSWRLGPHCELLLQTLACLGVVEMFVEPGSFRRRGVVSLALLSAGAGFLAMYYGDRNAPAIPTLVLSLIGAALLAKVGSASTRTIVPARWRPTLAKAWERGGPTIALVAAIACVAPIGIHQMGFIRQRSSLLNPMNRDEADLYAWMRSTAKDARFLTPPNVERMRYHGQRSIVVDWKSNPIVPGELLEWYRRLEDVTGRAGFSSGRDLDGYNAMDRARLAGLRAR
jgi:hypothetical protein